MYSSAYLNTFVQIIKPWNHDCCKWIFVNGGADTSAGATDQGQAQGRLGDAKGFRLLFMALNGEMAAAVS
jgi:hypothetical protein